MVKNEWRYTSAPPPDMFMAWTGTNLHFYSVELRPLIGPFSISRVIGECLLTVVGKIIDREKQETSLSHYVNVT
jgi:hypothetical protein